MAEWKMIKAYRKNITGEVRADEVIYLPSYTKGVLWESPKCFASYKIAVCDGEELDFGVIPIVNGQNVSFELGGYMNRQESYITFYIWEGDL